MGASRKAFDAVYYTIAIMALLCAASMFFGIGHQFGSLFSAAGFVALCFMVFAIMGS